MTAAEAVQLALAAIAAHEPSVHAWVHLDRDGAVADAERTDAVGPRPLTGVFFGVKDNIDTAELPTEYGSQIYRGFQPRSDAAVVALLRAAGATLVGKTVTVEFAYVGSGPTRNPHNLSHTPGGSSMGSAAAVAAGMADLTIGTQTGGSVTRPASYCGVFGFKPTFGSISTAGVKLLCPSLDTVGWFTRDVDLLDRVRVVLTGRPPARTLSTPPRLALLRSEHWDHADADSQAAVLEAAGAFGPVDEASEPEPMRRAVRSQKRVMAYEAARSLTWERLERSTSLTPAVRDELNKASSVTAAEYDEALAHRAAATASIEGLFGGAEALITPATTGEAPSGHDFTGDPLFARTWTLLGLPTVSLPWALGHSALPVGVQVIGRPGDDARLLAIAAALSERSPRVAGAVVPICSPSTPKPPRPSCTSDVRRRANAAGYRHK